MLTRISTGAAATARVLVPACILGALLPACSLVTDFGPRYSEYALSAHVVSADGATVTPVSYGDMKLGDPGATNRARFDAITMSDADVLRWWRRYLQAHVGTAEFGTGPWCLVQARAVGGRPMPTGTVMLTPDVSGSEMGDCSSLPALPDACANPAGATPSLGLAEDPVYYGTPEVPVPVGTVETRAVAFSNAGSGRLCLAFGNILGAGASSFEADFADFSGLDDACTDLTVDEAALGFKVLESGQSCALNVRFRPDAHGEFAAYLAVASNAADSRPQRLTGFGWAGTLTLTGDTPTTFDMLAVDPAHVCVPYAAPTGAMTYRRYLTLRNSGPGVVTLRSLAGATAEWRPTDFSTDESGAFAHLPGTAAPDFRPLGDVVLTPGHALRFAVQSLLIGTPPPLPPAVTLPFAGNHAGGPIYEIHLEPNPAGVCEP